MSRLTPTARAEHCLIHSVLVDNAAIDLVETEPEEFSHVGLQEIWRTMRDMREKGASIDDTTLEAALPEGVRDSARAEVLDALALDAIPSNVEHYARIVRQSSTTRRVLELLTEIDDQYKRHAVEGEDLLNLLMRRASAIDGGVSNNGHSIGDLMRESFENVARAFDAHHAGREHLLGVTTGVKALDDYIGGFPVGVLSVVAGRPGMGKSALGMTISLASDEDSGAHVFSLEDARQAYCNRAAARECGISAQQIRSGRLSIEQFRDYQAACESYRDRKGWWVDDRSGLSAEQIGRAIRRHKRANNTRIVIVDYLQLMARPAHTKSRHEAISYNVNQLADIAKSEKIAMVVMSQLNRAVESRPDKRPLLSDLRESGTIEERAKLVIFCWRGSYYGLSPECGRDYEAGEPPPTYEQYEQQIDLLVAKNSNGRTGVVRARWDGPTTRVY